mmetsp:Transcript_17747/g.21541  ORF Transcript_17747/g.21541 Transcript_17747/m.21541 type:complete len:240 (-) Transcript_17747:984-1703(-)
MAGREEKSLQKPVLYSYWRSSCSWRIRLALELKKVEYSIQPVHLVKDGGEQKQENYMKINPMKQVPSLIMNGKTLTQSVAIIEYLDETVTTGKKLLPSDGFLRARARSLVEMINSGIQPVQNLAVLTELKRVANITDEDDKAELVGAWGREFIERGFEAIEKELSILYTENPGDYCLGGEISIVDLFLVPQVYNANRFKVDMTKFPRIQQISESLSSLPEFIVAHPDSQPDSPQPILNN